MAAQNRTSLDEFIKNHLETLESCSICQEHFNEDHPPVRITGVEGCTHIFGYTCLIAWLESASPQANTCPLCRTQLYEKDHDYNYDYDDESGSEMETPPLDLAALQRSIPIEDEEDYALLDSVEIPLSDADDEDFEPGLDTSSEPTEDPDIPDDDFEDNLAFGRWYPVRDYRIFRGPDLQRAPSSPVYRPTSPYHQRTQESPVYGASNEEDEEYDEEDDDTEEGSGITRPTFRRVRRVVIDSDDEDDSGMEVHRHEAEDEEEAEDLRVRSSSSRKRKRPVIIDSEDEEEEAENAHLRSSDSTKRIRYTIDSEDEEEGEFEVKYPRVDSPVAGSAGEGEEEEDTDVDMEDSDATLGSDFEPSDHESEIDE